MGKIEGFQSPAVYRKRKSACMKRQRKQTSHNLVWVPKIPSWEREFCYRVGLFTWEEFLEAKKLTGFSHKIFEWNDSAAEEAFHTTKKRFFATINGLPYPDESDVPGPDSYIDEIDWDDHDGANPELLNGLELARDESKSDDEEEEEEKHENNHEHVPAAYHYIGIEDIKPTGWDIDIDETSRDKALTGLVVGI